MEHESFSDPEIAMIPSDFDIDRGLILKELVGLVSRLEERESFVLTRRYGLDGEGAETLQEIANQVKNKVREGTVTREVVRIIQERALKKLRYRYTRILYDITGKKAQKPPKK